jgi:hypothetical protein
MSKIIDITKFGLVLQFIGFFMLFITKGTTQADMQHQIMEVMEVYFSWIPNYLKIKEFFGLNWARIAFGSAAGGVLLQIVG